jgi:hypothetical protein
LKLDGCNADIKDYDTGYPSMENALNATGYPIAFSCSWPAYDEFSKVKPNYSAIAQTCNLWRNWGDIDDSWDSVYSIVQWFGDNQDRLSPFHGPGHWNDPDMVKQMIEFSIDFCLFIDSSWELRFKSRSITSTNGTLVDYGCTTYSLS